jgi:acyl carrier protein
MCDNDKAILKTFLAGYLRGYQLGDNDDIFASGFVNSLFAMQLVLFVERAFGVIVENEDLELNNFRTIDALAQFISRKRSQATQSHVASSATI